MSGSNVSPRGYDEVPESSIMPMQLYKNSLNFLPLSSAGYVGIVQDHRNQNKFGSWSIEPHGTLIQRLNGKKVSFHLRVKFEILPYA